MRKRGLMIVLFLVLLAGSVSAWSTLTMPSPNSIYEGSIEAVRLSIDNFNKPQPIKEIQVTLPGVNITSVTLTPATLWQENHNGTFVRWFNDTVSTSSANDIFEFNAFVLPVIANTNVTLIVTKINQNGSNATENHTITILNDTTPPNITSINPLNSTLANTIPTITANVVEAESQLQTVNYTYGDCNGTNVTITLTCNGTTCTGNANFTSCNEGNKTWYALTAVNNVGGVNTILGNITFHGIPPNVTAVTPIPGTMYTESEAIYITANATDDTAVDKVRADITYPNGTTISLQLIQAAGNKYSKLFNATNQIGQYNVTIVANDTSGNINNSQKTNFKIVPDYVFTAALKPSTARPGRTVKINGTIKLLNGSDIPENQTTIEIQGTDTNKTLTNGTFSHTFNAPANEGTYNIYVKVYANSGYNYSITKKLIVNNPSTSSGGSGWGWDFDEFEGGEGIYIEDSGTTEIQEEPEPEPEDAGVAKAPEEPEPEPSAEQVIEEILNKPQTNQITGSAVGLGGATSLLALLLLVLGVATLAYSNAKIRGHVHKFAKEKVGSKFKKKEKTTKAFSDEEWEEYFKRLRED